MGAEPFNLPDELYGAGQIREIGKIRSSPPIQNLVLRMQLLKMTIQRIPYILQKQRFSVLMPPLQTASSFPASTHQMRLKKRGVRFLKIHVFDPLLCPKIKKRPCSSKDE